MAKGKGRPIFRLQTMKKNRAAVSAGTQTTLPLQPGKADLLKYTPADEIKKYYIAALAEEWGCPVERIRIYGCALPVITIYK